MKLIPHPIEEKELRYRLELYELLLEGVMEKAKMDEHKTIKIKNRIELSERFKLMKQDIKRTFYAGTFFQRRTVGVLRKYYDEYMVLVEMKEVKEEETREEMIEDLENEFVSKFLPINLRIKVNEEKWPKPTRGWWRESIRWMMFLMVRTLDF